MYTTPKLCYFITYYPPEERTQRVKHATRTVAGIVIGAVFALSACSSSGNDATSSSAGASSKPAAASSSGSASSASAGASSGSSAPESSACPTLANKYPSLKGQTLIVGTSPGPSNYDAPDPNDPNKVIGVEPDLLDAISTCLGFTYSFQKLDFNGLIPALQAKHINAIASGMYASDERAQQVSFVEYMKAGEASVVAKGNPKNLTSMESVCGVIAAEAVGTVENAIFDQANAACAAAGKPPVEILAFQGNDQAINAVDQGRADIFLTDSGVASYLAAKFPGIQVGFPIVSDFVFGLAVNKDDTTLLDALHDVLVEFHTSGQLNQIITHWGFAPEQVFPPAIKA